MKTILLNIALIAVATGIFRMLVPDKGFKKQIMLLISCFFLSALLSVCTGGKMNLSGFSAALESSGAYIDFTEVTFEQTKKEVAAEMSELVYELLEKEEIVPEKVYIIVNISDLYGISISEIRLVLSARDYDLAEIAQDTVRGEVGDEITVSVEEGSGS